jgi:diguanylate cyclase (GGDEF)-like protein/PAS domain S-box-containing protein
MAATSPNAIISADSAGIINYWNNAAASLFGYSAEEVLGSPVGVLFPERVRNLQTAEVISLVNGGVDLPTELQLALRARRSDGGEFPAEIAVSIRRDDDGTQFAAIFRNATGSEQGEKRLFALAHLDALTGLPNRASLMDKLRETAHAEAGTLLLLDLHGFKDVNDSLGHSVGDLLLSEVADRLCAEAASQTTIARTGADEFGILLPGVTDREHAAEHAENLRQLLQRPYAVVAEPIHLDVHIGVAICPTHGMRAEELLSNADLALQRAKSSIRGGHQFYSPSLRRAAVMRRSLESELRQALDQSQFEVFYQPQIRMADRSVVGAEALLRWNHPHRGLLSPSDFMSVLQAMPLAADVGDWVLKTACAQASAWRRAGNANFRIGVNLFESQFGDYDLPKRVEETLIANSLPAQALELEITENIMLRHDEAILVPLRELCAWGTGIAFDDYGTGYASLSLLKRFPVTRLKIDRSFVRNLCTDRDDAAIVQAVMYLGRRFELGIIAEGIETEAQEQALKLYGCTEAQGYLYSKPVPAEALTRLIAPDIADAVKTVA